jgi:hypothetical protein
MLDTTLKVWDTATKEVEAKVRQTSQAFAQATISAGYELRAAVKEGMRAEAPGGEAWPPAHPWTRAGIIRRAKSRMTRAKKQGKGLRAPRRTTITGNKKALGKLAGAVRLDKTGGGEGQETRVRVGFLTARVAELAAYAASGPHIVPVTPKMRRFLFAAGLVIFAKSLKIPRRPHVEVVFAKNSARVQTYIDACVKTKLAGGDPRGFKAGFR